MTELETLRSFQNQFSSVDPTDSKGLSCIEKSNSTISSYSCVDALFLRQKLILIEKAARILWFLLMCSTARPVSITVAILVIYIEVAYVNIDRS